MALLEPDTARIGRPIGQPAEDRVPEALVSGTPRELREALTKLIGADQVLHRAIDLVRYASDASPYRLIPQVVVAPRSGRRIRMSASSGVGKTALRDFSDAGQKAV